MTGRPDPDAGEIIRLYRDQKLSIAAVAARTGATRHKVDQVITAAGVKRTRRGRPRAEAGADPAHAALIIEACTGGGMTREQAGALHGVSRHIVSRVLREHGLLSPDAAAALAGIRPPELRALAISGAVRCAGRGDGRHLYYRDDMVRLAASRQMLAALCWTWDGVYQVTEDPDGLEAWRTDGTGSVLAATPEGLRDAIREDYPKYAAGTAL